MPANMQTIKLEDMCKWLSILNYSKVSLKMFCVKNKLKAYSDYYFTFGEINVNNLVFAVS